MLLPTCKLPFKCISGKLLSFREIISICSNKNISSFTFLDYILLFTDKIMWVSFLYWCSFALNIVILSLGRMKILIRNKLKLKIKWKNIICVKIDSECKLKNAKLYKKIARCVMMFAWFPFCFLKNDN